MALPTLRSLLLFCVWLFFYYLSVRVSFGIVYFLFSLLLFILLHVFLSPSNSSPHVPSAYAAFNKDSRPIPGTLTGEQFDRQLRHSVVPSSSPPPSSSISSSSLVFVRESKYSNVSCPCGSGRKYKKCCSMKRGLTQQEKIQRKQEYKQWKEEWT